jgi:hypothetical protein
MHKKMFCPNCNVWVEEPSVNTPGREWVNFHTGHCPKCEAVLQPNPPLHKEPEGKTDSISKKIKVPKLTGDPYVDSCFQLDFDELDEPRVWHEIAELKDIPLLADSDKKKALDAAEKALKAYPDYDFAYFWVGNLRGLLAYPGEPRKTYREGMKRSRSKLNLCIGVANWEFEQNNLAEAVRWYIRSCALQLGGKMYRAEFPFLNLAYIAEGLNLAKCKTALLKQVERIRNIKFDTEGANKRYRLAAEQGNDSIKKAISLLCDYYL